MVSATIDHMISITVFIAALLIFINLFGQTNQTAIVYEQHKAIATKCSDLLDNMLLTPGNPSDWGKSNGIPNGFGLQDPEFTQYQLSSFSLMRLASSDSTPVQYSKTTPRFYNNITVGYDNGFSNSLLVPASSMVNFSLAQKLLGINNTYGFQLTINPIVNVSITGDFGAGYLRLNVSLAGMGFPLADACINSCLVKVSLPATEAEYPAYTLITNSSYADEKGFISMGFPALTDENLNYAFVAYAHLGGLVGAGSYQHVSSADQYVVPLVGDVSQQQIILAHNYDVDHVNPHASTLKYNATFVALTEDFSLREMPITSSNTTGTITSGVGNPYVNLTIPTYTPGILIVPYQQIDNPAKGGVIMMPWGISPLAFPISFGGDPQRQEWVATDIRQVIINHVAYQAKLSLWKSSGQEVG